MRYVLNWAIKSHEILIEETNDKEVGIYEQRICFFVHSIKLAKNYYKSDLEYSNQGSENFESLKFGLFGLYYSKFLGELSNSLLDSSAQNKIERLNLGILQWDFYRDLDNKAYAPLINKIKNQLEIFPTDAPKDDQISISFIREIKKSR